MKMWDARYALTDGIIEVYASHCDNSANHVIVNGFIRTVDRDIFGTREEAVKRAVIMRDQKIESLRRQIDKLERLDFKS